MANSVIQIKRSTTNAAPTGLANGELAYTANGEILFLGHPDGVTGSIAIGGKRNPGTLTANQALVANSTSGIDKVIVANLVPTVITANGALGTGGQTLTSNSSGGVYWSSPTAGVAGSDTQVQFNDGGSLAGDAGLTYNKTTDTLSAGKVAVVNATTSSNTTTGALTVAGGVGVAGRINTTDLAAGNDSVYSSLTGTQLSTANVFATATVNATVLSVGSWVIANNSGIFTSGVVNGDIVSVGTAFKANTSQVTIGTGVGFSVNGSVGTAGQILYSNGTSSYWAAAPTGDVTSVTAGSGLTGGGSSGDLTLDVGAGAGISVAADSVAVNANNGIVANSDGVFVNANNGIIANSTGVFVNANTTGGLVANSTALSVKVGTGVTFDGSGNLTIGQAVTTTSNVTFNDITASGNLVVNGTLVTLDVETLQVEDPLIALARLNTAADTVDIGLYGTYNDGSTRYSGIFRDASNSDIWTIFANTTVAPTTTVDTGGAGYALGGLLAGSLTLGTALAVGSGGTGQNSLTNNYVLVGNTTGPVQMIGSSTEGHVLQVTSSGAVAFGVLDGGTF